MCPWLILHALKIFDFGIAGLALTVGIKLLQAIGSGSTGFRFLGIWLIVIGVILLILALLMLIPIEDGDVNSQKWMSLGKSLCCDFPLGVTMTALGIFALTVSSSAGGGMSIPGRAYKEYRFETYSKWMQHKVNDHNWNGYYKNVVVKDYVCNKMVYDYQSDSLTDFHKRKLNPYESGCCKPPEECNFNYTIPTVWVKQESSNYTNGDCDRWDNDVHTLCFNCNSCKAAFLEDVNSHFYLAGWGLVGSAIKTLTENVISIICVICVCCYYLQD